MNPSVFWAGKFDDNDMKSQLAKEVRSPVQVTNQNL